MEKSKLFDGLDLAAAPAAETLDLVCGGVLDAVGLELVGLYRFSRCGRVYILARYWILTICSGEEVAEILGCSTPAAITVVFVVGDFGEAFGDWDGGAAGVGELGRDISNENLGSQVWGKESVSR